MIFPRITDYPIIGIDIEATGLRWWVDKMFGFSVSTPDGEWYFDIRKVPGALRWAQTELPKVKRWVAHHAKFEAHFLREAGVNMDMAGIECSMIRAALLDEHQMEYDLDTVAAIELGSQEQKVDIWTEMAKIFGGSPTKRAQIANLPNAPVDLVKVYTNQDARLARLVWLSQERKIEEQELQRVYRVERKLLPVIIRMEQRGVRVDVERAEEAVIKIDSQALQAQLELNKLAGFPVNPNPSASIHKLFAAKETASGAWMACDGTVLKSTPAGKPSYDKETLQRMRHPAAKLILRTREMIKLRDTFLRGHVLGHHHNGVVHANFNQTKTDGNVGTGTGRLSVNDPALQQIHKRNKEAAAIIRPCFLSDPEHVWGCRDWDQMDFRIFAHYANVPSVISAYNANPDLDYHQLVSDLTGLVRNPTAGVKGNAKQINLGLVFGMGKGRLAQEMGLPYTIESKDGFEFVKPGAEAINVFNRYHAAVPGVESLLRGASDLAKTRGFVKTALGRRIRFPGGRFTHKAGGLVFQGTAADALKVKLIEVDEYLESLDNGARIILNVHDEFDVSLPKDNHKEIDLEIKKIIEDFSSDAEIKLRVPIRSGVGFGPNWGDASL